MYKCQAHCQGKIVHNNYYNIHNNKRTNLKSEIKNSVTNFLNFSRVTASTSLTNRETQQQQLPSTTPYLIAQLIA